MTDQRIRRERMVARLIEGRGVDDPRVLAAMREVPRHRFVEEALADKAYGDHALPIGQGQTISQPIIVARMAQILELQPGQQKYSTPRTSTPCDWSSTTCATSRRQLI